MAQPTLTTQRLVLRPYQAADAHVTSTYLNDIDIWRTTMNIPHPYTRAMAEEFIAKQPAAWAEGKSASYAIGLRAGTKQVIGGISLKLKTEHRQAELGYVIYKPWWGRGYATEAARALIEFGFRTLNLIRIDAQHFSGNDASGRVMIKCGMTLEGIARQDVIKGDEVLDSHRYAILREEWERVADAAR